VIRDSDRLQPPDTSLEFALDVRTMKLIVIIKIEDQRGWPNMYVCVCNAVTDRQIRSQSECTRGTVAEVYRALGIKLQCGKCVRTAKCIIDELQPPARDTAASIPAFAMAD
jgi:bacterioferritin-associated ferredoxin